MSLNTDQSNRRVVLTYSPHGNIFPVERTFDGVTDDQLAHIAAMLAGRRYGTEYSGPDMEQLKAMRHDQMAWYAQRMVDALYDGLGRWYKLIPARVRLRVVQLMMDYLKDVTASWTSELIAAHSETSRIQRQARALRVRPRPAPAPEPKISCRCCDATFVRADFLPEGWTPDHDGFPRCPQHAVVRLTKESAT
jgi:hypothetical protein